ncbi:MAG: DNA polymerase III subunit gamma/tau [Oscillospiraceae bacterium]|nr:DNA polymerase III subunit gamma/tau [Oscillospiraceae bacterium]
MAHQAIYRKWRPMVFEDIIGQGHITRTLENQILNGKIGHAYLFCGTRGTGKTTCAKVFSRAVNCLNPQNGSPCNECDVCKGIIDGSILDVKEIDAASNNGVDNIREIRDDVRYVSTNTKYTVYIIDEVHMLSSGAFNALLKTLEEPPEYVIFILATTEAHKVPQTILSRCQRFDFKRIKPSDIILRMKEIAHGDGLTISDDAYDLLARLADGSMRDGLSILERVVSACGNEITAKDITDTLGISATESVFNITNSIIDGDINGVISVIDTLLSDGKDLRVFIDSLIKNFRDMLICKVSDNPGAILDYAPEDMVKLNALSQKLSFEKISHAAAVLSDAQADTKWVKSPRIIYELALIKLAKPEFDDSTSAVLDRLTSLENKVANGAVTDTSSLSDRIKRIEDKIKNGVKVSAPEPKKEEAKKDKPATSVRLYRPIPEYELTADNPIVKAAKNWNNISRTMANSAAYLKPCLMNRAITIDADGIIMLYKRAEKGAHDIGVSFIDRLRQAFKRASGTDFNLKIAYEDEIQEDLVDFWALTSSGANPENENDSNNSAVSVDPLENLIENFGEIIEDADESEFIEYDSSRDAFSQSSFDDDEDREEFLEGNEIPEDDENI